MPLCKLMTLHTKERVDIAAATTRRMMADITELLESTLKSQSRVQWLQQTENLKILYLLSECNEEDGHVLFSVSEQHGGVPEKLGEVCEIASASVDYIDIRLDDIPLASPVISIGYHKVHKQNKDGFEEFFQRNRHLVDDYVTVDQKGNGGWVLGADEGEDVLTWTLFLGWESWEQHFLFVKTEAFKQYGKILGYLSGYDSRHASRLDLAESHE